MFAFEIRDAGIRKQHIMELGETFPFTRLTSDDILFVRANSAELDYIVANFQNVPLAWHKTEQGRSALNYTHTWFGDAAKFIYHNLEWVSE